MTEFADAHQGDTIHLLGHLTPPQPLLLVTEPAPCGDPGCLALRCVALTSDGRCVFLHRRATREIDVLEHGPASELATRSGDVLAEHAAGPTVRGGDVLPAEIEADYERRKDHDDTPNDEGEQH